MNRFICIKIYNTSIQKKKQQNIHFIYKNIILIYSTLIGTILTFEAKYFIEYSPKKVL